LSEHEKGGSDSGGDSESEPFPRGKALPSQSPLFWVQQKDRYLRQLLIRDIEAQTGRRLIVYFLNRFENAQIDPLDPTYLTEMFEDTTGESVDLLLETGGGWTDPTERVVSIIEHMAPDLRVVVAGSAKSNGTVICLAGKSIVMGASSELGPIEPHLQGMPCTILAMPAMAQQNFVMHQAAIFAIEQTRKLARRLLKQGMKSTATDEELDNLVHKLLSRDLYFSHGSVIDHKEAKTLGLNIEYLPPENDLWQRLRLLLCMYEGDARNYRYLKFFETRKLSSAIEAPIPVPQPQEHK
jgi:hypothetical protein